MTIEILKRGLMLVLSSPSGAGKSTLTKMLVEREENCMLSISMTTRAKRPAEVHGVHYHFVSEAEFFAARDRGELLEWAKVFDHYYGTPKMAVEQNLKIGKDVLFDIDWQGTQQLHTHAEHDLVRVFILPPSAVALEDRLKSRAQDSADVVARRMAGAAQEIQHWAEYDYVVINYDLEDCYTQIEAILTAERLKRKRQPGLVDFVRTLQNDLPKG